MEVRRENLQRDVQVTARFEHLDLGSGMKSVQQAIADLKMPPSIRVQYGGLYAEQQASFKEFEFVLGLAIVLVFAVLLFEFGNFAAPIAVLSSALLSTCGVFLALLLTNTTFNLSSFMGLIMVVGIVAKNGILLLDADQRFRGEGVPAECLHRYREPSNGRNPARRYMLPRSQSVRARCILSSWRADSAAPDSKARRPRKP